MDAPDIPPNAHWDAVVIDPKDNVAIALSDLSDRAHVRAGDRVYPVLLQTLIPTGHKFALHALKPGAMVIKYGEPIGITTAPIQIGEHVHTHNLQSRRATLAPVSCPPVS